MFSGESTTVSYLAISSWNSLSKASFGSSLIFGLFLMFFALFAYLCQMKDYFQTGFQMHFSTEVNHANKLMRRAAVERPFFSITVAESKSIFMTLLLLALPLSVRFSHSIRVKGACFLAAKGSWLCCKDLLATEAVSIRELTNISITQPVD